MNNLTKTTITTLEIAEMMETEHWIVLRKLEGQEKMESMSKDILKY